MRRLIHIVIVVLFCIVDTSSAEWEEVAGMNVARHHHTAVAADGNIYVFGGLTDNGRAPVESAEKYDPDNDEWVEIEPMPAAIHQSAAVYDEPYIYIFGGESGRGRVNNTILLYDLEQDEYSVIARLPVGLRGLAAVNLGEGILLIGGVNPDNDYSESCYMFFPGNNQIRTFAPLNEPRIGFGVATLERQVWVVGGVFHGPLNSVERLQNQEWQYAARMPRARVGLAVEFLDGYLIVTGGSFMRMMGSESTIAYNPRNQQWIDLEDMNYGRVDHAMVRLNDAVYVIGGASSDEHNMPVAMNSVERLSEVVSAPGEVTLPSLDNPVMLTPNPVNGPVRFRLTGLPTRISIFDLRGRPVSVHQADQGSFAWSWNSSQYPAGAYFYNISIPGHDQITGRIIVVK